MKKKMKIVGLGGSMGKSSSSLAALKIALEGAAQAGAETELLDIRTLNLPMYAPSVDVPEAGSQKRVEPALPGRSRVPWPARRLAETVYEAQGLIWSSPLYHGTVSGAFKNALDWLELLADRNPSYLTDKAVGLISTAGGVQGLQAINTMEFIVRALRGWAVPLVLPVARAWQVFDEKGKAKDPKVEAQLRALGAEVTRAARRFFPDGGGKGNEARN